MLTFLKPRIALWHCLSGKTISLDRNPLLIGGVGADFEIERGGRALCEIGVENGSYFLNSFGGLLLNVSGLPRSKMLLQPEEDYSLIVEEHALVLCLTVKPGEWLQSRSLDQWTVRDPEGRILDDPISLRDLPMLIARYRQEQPDAIVHQQNSTAGFRLDKFAAVLGIKEPKVRAVVPQASASKGPSVVAKAVPKPIAKPSAGVATGQFACFNCRQPFDREQVLQVAVHPSLKGDAILGPNEMRRFKAEAAMGTPAVDAMGMPTTEVACPHCRRKLPVNFFDSRPLVITLVGSPVSDRAAYLGALIGRSVAALRDCLGASLFDGDAIENRRLLELQRRLFSKGSASALRVAKAELDADWRMEVWLRGKWVWMPKPFVFGISLKEPAALPVQLIFYGCEPELSAATPFDPEPKVMHFLLDPSGHPGFRQKLGLPLGETPAIDPQEKALVDLRERMTQTAPVGRCVPLAVLVDKFELWRELIADRASLEEPLADGKYQKRVVQEYSARLRALLCEVAPAIVEAAEAISLRVLYYPISSLGCPSERIGEDPDGRPVFSPDPRKIDPIGLEVPLLWSLRVDKSDSGGGG